MGFLEILLGEFWREDDTKGYVDVIKDMYNSVVTII